MYLSTDGIHRDSYLKFFFNYYWTEPSHFNIKGTGGGMLRLYSHGVTITVDDDKKKKKKIDTFSEDKLY